MKFASTIAAAAALALAAGAANAALGPGSIAFTMFNADANDDISFVALEPIAAGTTIHFRDDEWNGTAFGDAAEMAFSWTAPITGVAAGDVVLITDLTPTASTTLAANVGSVVLSNSGNPGLNATDEGLWAYTSTGDWTTGTFTFLTAITNAAAFGGTNNGVLTGTGLTSGTDAFIVSPASTDIGAYAGLRDNQASFAAYLAQVYNIANWQVAAGSGDQSVGFRPFNTTAFVIPAPGAVALLGLGGLIAARRKRN